MTFLSIKAFVLACLLTAGATASAQTTLRLAAIENSQISTVSGQTISKVLLSMGINVEIIPMPSARATVEARAGRIDGEVARIATFAANYPELMRVDPPYFTFQTVAFSKKSSHIAIKSPEDLKAYKVGIVRGIQHSEAVVAGVAEITRTSDAQQLLKMLEAGRFDIAIDSRLNGEALLNKLGFSDISEVGTLGQQDIFLYLNTQHQSLAPAIGKTITKLKDAGSLQQIIKAVQANY